jgi:hypothetical protein
MAPLGALFLAGFLLPISGREGSGVVPADPETLIREGNELRRNGQDAIAEGYFRRAYEIAPTPRTAAQLGLVELALEDYLAAERHLSDALNAKDAWIEGHLQALEGSRAMARAHLIRVEIAGAPSGATFSVEGSSPRPVPPDGLVWLAAATPQAVHVQAPGRAPAVVQVQGPAGATRRVVVEMGEAVELRKALPIVAAPETQMPSPPPTSASGRGLRTAGVVVAAVGAASAAVGGALYAEGLSRRNDYRRAIQNGAPYDSSYGQWQTLRDTGVGLLIGGAAASLSGAGLYVLGLRTAHLERGPSLSFIPCHGLRLLVYRRSF